MGREGGQRNGQEQKEVHAVTMSAFRTLIKVEGIVFTKLDKSNALW
jgi:hypothetical protein